MGMETCEEFYTIVNSSEAKRERFVEPPYLLEAHTIYHRMKKLNSGCVIRNKPEFVI